MAGVITAVYMSSGNGRTGDSNNGQQDEIDWEWKGEQHHLQQRGGTGGGVESPTPSHIEETVTLDVAVVHLNRPECE